MKRQLKSILCWGLCLAAYPAIAQVTPYPAPGTTPRSDTTAASTTRETGESQMFCRSKDLVGANIKDAQGKDLGDIDEVFISPRNGETFASIGVGDGRYALVPIQALQMKRAAGALRNAEFTLDSSKDALKSGPTVAKNEWQKLDDQSFVHGIYGHYNLHPRPALGGVGTGSIGGASTGFGSSDTNYTKHPKR